MHTPCPTELTDAYHKFGDAINSDQLHIVHIKTLSPTVALHLNDSVWSRLRMMEVDELFMSVGHDGSPICMHGRQLMVEITYDLGFVSSDFWNKVRRLTVVKGRQFWSLCAAWIIL